MDELLKKDGEQLDITSQGAEAHVEMGESECSSSPFGKFKSADDLLHAYNNLQSEFTRKCQRLSELESTASVDKNISPQYESDNWHEQIGEFLESHPDAKEYASEIAHELYSDKTLASNPSSLELAYLKILAKNHKSYEALASDEDFLNKYIYSNQAITNKILNDYFKDYSKSPQLISSKVGASVNLTPTPKASNLSEAKKLVAQLFSN